ncbi:glycosyltransferase family 2 protein [Mucilaginibacter auburnensis]|uniref:Glycosyl transferase family 2 n=1 Tax=Mucilaginibacter auburnensis TaxID=1457233 RepID=A0A2H9VPC3_9SPHI|nr:glycosyltransferase family 2 protein [Mucilaginibacter auburnensis]PJJ80140.1 glycosyl transferase family 2 [Mucilaginibacter auburnensis]
MNSTPAAISIIIVTYNAANTLQACLDSIYKQTYPQLKIIIIDGNSTDGTVDIIKANAANIHFWMSEPDKGVYDAMNKGVTHLAGDWVYFIGADDEMLPEFSNFALELTDENAIYYANVFAEGSKRLGELTRYQIAKCGPYHQAMIYPRSVFDKHRYNTRYKISADFALTLDLCGDSNYHFVYKDYTICNFNHTGLSGTIIDEPFQKEKASLIYKNFGLKTWFRYRVHKFKHRDNPRA